MRNGLRTAALFIALTGVLAAVGAIIGYLVGQLWTGLLIMIIISVVINIYSYYFSKRTVLRRYKVRIITESENPRLYRIVQNVSQKAGLPMPEVGITQNPSPNAFATGRGPKDAAVVATSGILTLLSDEELEGVVAHELAHVKNRDVLVMSVAATVAGIISYLANWLIWMALISRNNNQNNAIGVVAAVIGAITLPIAAMLIQLSISRGREFGADKKGAEFTGNPMALASALRRLETGIAAAPMDKSGHYGDYSDAHLWIETPSAKSKGFAGMFSTHPTTEDRIKRLEQQAKGMGRKNSEQENPFL